MIMTHNRLSLAAIFVIVGVGAWLFFNPPRFWLNWSKQVEPTATVGAQLVEQYRCRSCHRIGGEGALKATPLDGVARRVGDPAQVTLRLWLRNPKAVRANTAMPNFHLSDSEIDAILLYLNELEPP
jgi:mono/diheme cytochrome c family protein